MLKKIWNDLYKKGFLKDQKNKSEVAVRLLNKEEIAVLTMLSQAIIRGQVLSLKVTMQQLITWVLKAANMKSTFYTIYKAADEKMELRKIKVLIEQYISGGDLESMEEYALKVASRLVTVAEGHIEVDAICALCETIARLMSPDAMHPALADFKNPNSKVALIDKLHNVVSKVIIGYIYDHPRSQISNYLDVLL